MVKMHRLISAQIVRSWHAIEQLSVGLDINEPRHVISNNVTVWHDCVDSDEPVQPSFKLRNSKWCSVSSLTVIEYSSDKQRLRSHCAYAQADLRLCWSHIPHCWKSHFVAHLSMWVLYYSTWPGSPYASAGQENLKLGLTYKVWWDGFFAYTFSLILIYFTKYPYSSQILFSLLLSRCLSQHKLKFWTGIRQKIRCGMVLVGMDS